MKAAFYECDVTPPLGGFMWGHYHDTRAYDVYDRLYAKALVVEDGGETAAIVAVDTCAIPEDMHDAVTKRIHEYTGIAPERVCITSGHTHSGAPISSDPTVECHADAAYRDVFLRLCADAVILAYKRLEDVELKFAKTEVYDISFNRNFVLKDGSYVTHGRGRTDVAHPLDDIDPDVPVLMFEKDGQPIGAIVSFACHQCCLGQYDGYSGDYSSILSKRLKAEYGNNFVSLFMLGACGDINHVNPDASVPIPPLQWYRHMGDVLADAVLSAVQNAQPVTGGVQILSKTVEIQRRLPDQELVRRLLQKWMSKGDGFMRARNLIHYESVNRKTSTELIVQGIRIGDVLISALPGEIYNAIGKGIKKDSPFERTIVVENCNSYCGYIPNKEAFCEQDDLYETALCLHSCHVPEAGDILRKEAVLIAQELAR